MYIRRFIWLVELNYNILWRWVGILLTKPEFIQNGLAKWQALNVTWCICRKPNVYVFISFCVHSFGFQIAQALQPIVRRAGFWGSVRTLARGYEIVMGLLLFTPVAFLAWFPFVSEFQTRMLFNQAFSRGLQISRILGGQRKDRSSPNKD